MIDHDPHTAVEDAEEGTAVVAGPNDDVARAEAAPDRRLPLVIWSRLYFDLKHYLAEHSADETTVLAFYHRQLKQAIAEHYLEASVRAARSRHLARYFARQPLERRSLSELPFAQAQAGLDEELETTLLDPDFMRAKIEAVGLQSLIDDYDLATPATTEQPWDPPLVQVQAALRQSSHVVTEDIASLAGQLTGRLSSSGHPQVQDMLAALADRQKGPWLRPLLTALTPPGPLLRSLPAHDRNLAGIALTRIGDRAITASSDHTIRIWDVASGGMLQSLEHERALSAIAVSPRQGHLISAGRDRTLRLWEIETGLEVQRLTKRLPEVIAVAVSDDLETVTLATAGEVRHWRLDGGEELWRVRISSQRQHKVSLSANGGRVVYGFKTKLKLVDVAKRVTREIPTDLSPAAVAISGDGRRLAVATVLGTLLCWDAEDLDAEPTAIPAGAMFRSLSLSYDGRWGLGVMRNSDLMLWDLPAESCVADIKADNASIGLLPDDAAFAYTDSGARAARVWDLRKEFGSAHAVRHDFEITAVALSKDSRYALSACVGGHVILWDVANIGRVTRVYAHPSGIAAVAFDPAREQFVTAGKDGQIKTWALFAHFPEDEGWNGVKGIQALAVVEDGLRAIAKGRGGNLVHWHISGRERNRSSQPAHVRSVTAIALTPDGRHIASTGSDRALQFRDAVSGALRHAASDTTGVSRAVAISADGQRAITALRTSLKLWDRHGDKPLATLRGHRDRIEAVALDGAGRRAVSVGRDRRLILWDADRGEALCQFRGDVAFTACGLSADGKTVVAGDIRGAFHLLRVEDGEP